MFFTALQVAAGGAIGATLRYLFGMGVPRLLGQHSLPLSILLTNIIGSTLMGLLVSFLGIKGLTQWNAFLGVGVLGGFTTFSSFSLETWTLVERGEPVLAEAGARSVPRTWDEVAAAEADVVVVVPCGMDLEEAERQARSVADRPGIAGARLAAADGIAHFVRPGPGVVASVEALAAVLHPGALADRPEVVRALR